VISLFFEKLKNFGIPLFLSMPILTPKRGMIFQNSYLTVKLLIEPHGALLEGVNDCSFKNRV